MLLNIPQRTQPDLMYPVGFHVEKNVMIIAINRGESVLVKKAKVRLLKNVLFLVAEL